MSLRPTPVAPDVRPVLDLQRRLGEDGLVILGPGDALGLVCGMFHFDDFVAALLEDEGLILEMLRAVSERLNEGLRKVCSQVTGVCVRFWGPEYAGAPLLNPHRYFGKLVVEFDREAVRIVNESGNFSVVHCHGRLADILDGIAELRATALEPLEVLPAATADVTIEQVKRRLGDRMCLMGGIQAAELELLSPEGVAARVREILEAAAPGGGFILLPTSAPIEYPLSPRLVENYRAYFQAAHDHGRYGSRGG
jgi:uroporphyrinogen decarboxylase